MELTSALYEKIYNQGFQDAIELFNQLNEECMNSDEDCSHFPDDEFDCIMCITQKIKEMEK